MARQQSTVSHALGDGESSWLAGWRLDAVVTTLAALLVAGVAWDFRTHASGISFAEEGFLTAPHVFFYSMFLLIAAVIGAATYRNRMHGSAWNEAVPEGYALGVLGVGRKQV